MLDNTTSLLTVCTTLFIMPVEVDRMKVEQIAQRIGEQQEKLNEKAKKLASLKALMLDPDLSEYLANIAELAKGTNGTRGAASRSAAPAPNTTGLRAQIRALELLPVPFTVEDVVRALKAREFDFDGRRPEQAVRDSLYMMAKKKKGIRLVKKGQGGEPNQYEKT